VADHVYGRAGDSHLALTLNFCVKISRRKIRLLDGAYVVVDVSPQDYQIKEPDTLFCAADALVKIVW
jgi:hypothetical protein